MKIGSSLQYECPNECPKNCTFKGEFFNYGQNAMCGRCPVFSCKEPITEEDKIYLPLVPASQFRDDWAKEWDRFFKTGKKPNLYLEPPEIRIAYKVLDILTKDKKIENMWKNKETEEKVEFFKECINQIKPILKEME